MAISKNRIAAAAAAAVASLAAVPASAVGSAEHAPTRAVKVWDLDLARAADVATLHERLQHAASAVCRDEVQRHRRRTRMPAPTGWYERCVQAAVDSAVREIDGYRVAAAGSRRVL